MGIFQTTSQWFLEGLGAITIFTAWTADKFIKLATSPGSKSFWQFMIDYQYQFFVLGVFFLLYAKWRTQRWLFYFAAALIIGITIYDWWQTFTIASLFT